MFDPIAAFVFGVVSGTIWACACVCVCVRARVRRCGVNYVCILYYLSACLIALAYSNRLL